MTKPTCWRCEFCDHQFAGRHRKFCYDCLPAYSSATRRHYQKQYAFLWAASGHGPPAHQALTRSKIPKGHPANPLPPGPSCAQCGESTPNHLFTYCTPCGESVKQQNRRESGRLSQRRYRTRRNTAFLAQRRRGWAKRRATKRQANHEPYDALDIAERDRWRCQLCGKKIQRNADHLHPDSLNIDHILPLSAGGDDVAANVQATHRHCNVTKGNRVLDPGEQLRLL